MINLLPEFWYLATLSRKLTVGRSVPVTLLEQEVLLVRAGDGRVHAYADRCPHRGMRLRHGTCDGAALQCGYHGWRFRLDTGRCESIPSLVENDIIEPARFGQRRVPAARQPPAARRTGPDRSAR